MSMPHLLVVGGPTASGKTALAIELALRFDGEIVNADSRQVYMHLDIGTAKPTGEQRATVPHHLLDVASPAEEYSLALYQQAAYTAIDQIIMRGKLPILVGGTGLYLRAVASGFDVPRVAPNLALRDELSAIAARNGMEALMQRLHLIDPAAAQRIDRFNPRRVMRAIEVAEAADGPPRGDCGARPRYATMHFLLSGERALLYARAESRLTAMISAGFPDEVRGLLARGYSTSLPSMSALGYREMALHVQGSSTLNDARAATLARTRAFIKRQETWFRSEQDAMRLDIADTGAVRHALEYAEQWLISPH